MGCYLNYDNMCRNVLILLNGNLIVSKYSFWIIRKPIFWYFVFKYIGWEYSCLHIIFMCLWFIMQPDLARF